MRPRIVVFLRALFDTHYVNYIVPTGSILYIAAISAIVWLFVNRCKNTGLPTNLAWGAMVPAIFGAMIGARLFYLVLHLENTLEHPDLIWRLGRGTASWGAYLGGLSCFYLYLRKKKTLLLNYFDILHSVLGLGPFIARWACFLNGCCFGTATNLPWGVQFPQNSFAYNSHLKEGLIHSQDLLSLSVHPVQIYGSLAGLIIFFITSIFWKKYRKFAGLTFPFYWLLYGMVRFFVEFVRGDGLRYTALNLTQAQIIILVVIPISLLGMTYLYKRHKGYQVQ